MHDEFFSALGWMETTHKVIPRLQTSEGERPCAYERLHVRLGKPEGCFLFQEIHKALQVQPLSYIDPSASLNTPSE
jgi:hypothetical protein